MYDVDPGAALEIIERMRLARIGEYRRWCRLASRIKRSGEVSADDAAYLARFARVYDGARRGTRTRIYHVRLSEEDERPGCQTCRRESEFYCNQNDAYFCAVHVVGHDENER